MRILAIETSCDETAIAIADFKRGERGISVRVLSHLISSQAKLHTRFGGVVPNLARREHEKNLVPILMEALTTSQHSYDRMNVVMLHATEPKNGKVPRETKEWKGILKRESILMTQFKKFVVPLAIPDIDAIAVTYGPGLAPALWTGVNFARALATLWRKPLIPVNHMAGHLYSALLQKRGVGSLPPTSYRLQAIKFPALALLVSGAHTELILMKKHGAFKIIGCTRDDAAGEAFDKVARMLELKYPGGPEIAKLALTGNPNIYSLPRPMLHTKDYDFSFSGLKTAVLYLIRDLAQASQIKLTERQKADIAASFQAAAVEVLIKKTIRAAKEYKAKTLILGGGVSANAALRSHLGEAVRRETPNSLLLIPDSRLTGDNALMIAAAAYFVGKKMSPEQAVSLRADANATVGKMSMFR